MRMFRSFLLRLSLILSLTTVINLLLMTATFAISNQNDPLFFYGMIFILLLVWSLFNWFIIRKVDPELSMEVARIVLPSGAVLSVLLSFLMSLYMNEMIPGSEGKEHYILPFAGIGVAFFLIVRCFDIKWLRGEAEISLQERSQSE